MAKLELDSLDELLSKLDLSDLIIDIAVQNFDDVVPNVYPHWCDMGICHDVCLVHVSFKIHQLGDGL